MDIESVGEHVEAIVLFGPRSMQPVRIRWKGGVYKIRRVVSSWDQTRGLDRTRHLVVETDKSNVLELVFDKMELSWRIDRVIDREEVDH